MDKKQIDKYISDGKKRGKELDHYKMLKEINKLVDNDFCFDMECMQISKHKYTQEDAKKMAKVLASIYSISHCIYCSACQRKFIKIH